jgi:hypothetical protein
VKDSRGELQSAWARFWFQPTDPTTLALMRIVTGMLVLYVHVAYCFDFQSFFGRNAWWDQDAALKQRNELPFVMMPSNWDDYKQRIQVPQLADHRTTAFDFMRHLPSNKSERAEVLRYLEINVHRLGDKPNQVLEMDFIASLQLLKDSAALTSDERNNVATGMGGVQFESKKLLAHGAPTYFHQLSPDERVRVWRQSQELSTYLPAADVNFNYVLDWIREMSVDDRKDLIRYLNELPEGEEGLSILDYFEQWRVDPRDAYVRGRTTFSLWFHISDPATMWVCHALILFVILLFTLGFATRVTSVMTWLAALFYIHRNNSILFGMDTMMNVLLFYLMIGPSGAALSIDRLIERYRAARAIFMAGRQPAPWAEAVLAGPAPSAMANFTIRLIQIHFCCIYMSAGLSKLKGFMWWNTTATWYTIANPEFTPLYYPAYESFLRLAAGSKTLLLAFFGVFAYYTLILEISFPFLVWTRLRPYMVCGAIFLHSSIAWLMGLTCFGLLMMTLLLSYFPAAVLRERVTWKPGSGAKLTLRYNGRNPRHGNAVGFLRMFDLAGQISFQDESSTKSEEDMPIALVDEDGRVTTGDEIITHAAKTLVFMRLVRWMFWVPGVAYLVRRWAGARRAEESRTGESSAMGGIGGALTRRTIK